jgi:hypothetical protein
MKKSFLKIKYFFATTTSLVLRANLQNLPEVESWVIYEALERRIPNDEKFAKMCQKVLG